MLIPVIILLGLCSPGKVIKALSDELEHEYSDHSSGMRVFLSANENTEKCSAALRVDVGSLKNPPAFQGLAHFLEHAMFLGSSKYPGPKHFMQFLGENGGECNAYTSAFETVFFFNINCAQFDEALDIFAQMFISPLLEEEVALGELKQVNDEFLKNKQNQSWREYDLIKSLASPLTFYPLFSIGNNLTLKVPGVVSAMREFYKEHYHPSRYILSVYGLKIGGLRQSVEKAFQDLKADDIPANGVNEAEFYTAKQLGQLVKVESLKSEPSLNFNLLFEGNLYQMSMRPLVLLEKYMKSYHENSLLRMLQNRGWATEISTLAESLAGGQTHCVVSISLTPLGKERYIDIVNHFFAYAKLIHQGFDEAFYEATRTTTKTDFEYYSTVGSIDLVEKIVTAAALYPPERIFIGPYDMGPFSSQEFKVVMAQVVPERSIVVLSAQNLEGLKLQAQHYGTLYSLEPIDISTAQKDVATLHLPPALPFKLSLSELKALRTLPKKQNRLEAIEPVDLTPEENVQVSRLLYHHDERFGLPCYNTFFYLYLDKRNSVGADNEAAWELISALFEQESRLLTFQLDMVSTTLKLSPTLNSIELQIFGPSTLFETATTSVFNFVAKFFAEAPKEKDFDTQRTKLIQLNIDERKNFLYKYAHKASQWAIYTTKAPSEEMDAAYQRMTYKKFVGFLAGLRQEAFLETLITGSVSASQAITASNAACKAFGLRRTTEFVPPENPLREMLPTAGLLLPGPNPHADSSIVHAEYYLGPRSLVGAFAYILSTIVSSAFFNDVRTTQQSGYVVYARVIPMSGHFFLRFAIQSAQITSAESLRRIDAFVAAKVKELALLSPDQFDSLKKAAMGEFLQPFESFKEQSKYIKKQMIGHSSRFDEKWRMPQRIARTKLKKFIRMALNLLVEHPRRLHLHLVCEIHYAETKILLEEYTKKNKEVLYFNYADFGRDRAQLSDLSAVAQEL